MIVVSLREFTIVVSLDTVKMHQRKTLSISGNAYISPRIWRERYWDEGGGYAEEIINKKKVSERKKERILEKEM